MGLDTTHDCFHGSYGSFTRMRMAVLDAVGELPFVERNEGSYDIVGEYPERCYMGWWWDQDFDYEDPLEVLFVHSDCDGYIFWRELEPLAERLEGIIEKIDPEWQGRVRQFITGLRRAADDIYPVVFR